MLPQATCPRSHGQKEVKLSFTLGQYNFKALDDLYLLTGPHCPHTHCLSNTITPRLKSTRVITELAIGYTNQHGVLAICQIPLLEES